MKNKNLSMIGDANDGHWAFMLHPLMRRRILQPLQNYKTIQMNPVSTTFWQHQENEKARKLKYRKRSIWRGKRQQEKGRFWKLKRVWVHLQSKKPTFWAPCLLSRAEKSEAQTLQANRKIVWDKRRFRGWFYLVWMVGNESLILMIKSSNYFCFYFYL